MNNFLNEELASYEDLPEHFYDKDFIPSVEDLKPLSDEQITYLLECYNEDVSDILWYEDDELYKLVQNIYADDEYLATKINYFKTKAKEVMKSE